MQQLKLRSAMAMGKQRVDMEIESERGREVEETVGKRSGVVGDGDAALVLVHNGTQREDKARWRWQPWWECPAAWSPRTGQVSSVGAFYRTGVV